VVARQNQRDEELEKLRKLKQEKAKMKKQNFQEEDIVYTPSDKSNLTSNHSGGGG
jgi:hypothetical protein